MSNSLQREKLGFGGSMQLALNIVAGSIRLLVRYPVLASPLLPMFLLVLLTALQLATIQTLGDVAIVLGLIAFGALCLMFAFAVTTLMLRQLDAGDRPSLSQAVASREMVHMAPRILGLSILWYTVVFFLVLLQMIVGALLDRISEGLGDAVGRAIFGTVAGALRMTGFLMVAIMTFEDVGLRAAFRRVREIASDRSVAALGGLALTRLVTSAMVLLLVLLWQMVDQMATLSAMVIYVPAMGAVWMLSMFLQQLFVTGLYLYTYRPDSLVVEILLRDVMERELLAPVASDGAAS